MTKNDEAIQDIRSTGRRRARSTLFKARVDYSCAGWNNNSTGVHHSCGKTVKEPPKDAPSWFEDIWPLINRVLESQLQADHETKDLTQNSLEHLNWRCVSCHKRQDMQTEKGEQTTEVAKFFG